MFLDREYDDSSAHSEGGGQRLIIEALGFIAGKEAL